MRKVLLINPPDDFMIQGALPTGLGRDRMGKYPPLGLLYMASYARRELPDVDIRIADAITDGLGHSDMEAHIASHAPDVVGISVYTFTLIDGLKVAEAARRAAPDALVVLGGFHPGIYPQETLECSEAVDVVVAGEAEVTFTTLLSRLEQGRSLEGIPGVSYREADGGLAINRDVPYVEDLDDLPFPDRTMVNYREHTCILGTDRITTNILSSRGCPFSCKYCYVNIRKYRLRSIDSVLAEIRQCIGLGIGEFFFVDDLFNISRQRVLEFSNRVIDEGLDIRWCFRGRVDQVDPQMLAAAKKAGCTRIHYGVESGSPEVLKRVGKKTNLDMIRTALAQTRAAGIEVSSNLMLGLPDETPERTDQSIRFISELPTNYLQAAVFTPYPETPLYLEGLENGMFETDYWRDFARNPTPGFETRIWDQYYTREELFKKLGDLYRGFYIRPRFILSYLSHLTSFRAFRTMVKNFFTLVILISKTRSR